MSPVMSPAPHDERGTVSAAPPAALPAPGPERSCGTQVLRAETPETGSRSPARTLSAAAPQRKLRAAREVQGPAQGRTARSVGRCLCAPFTRRPVSSPGWAFPVSPRSVLGGALRAAPGRPGVPPAGSPRSSSRPAPAPPAPSPASPPGPRGRARPRPSPQAGHVPPAPAPAHCLFPAVRMRRRRSALGSVSARGCGGAGGSGLSGSSLGGGGGGSFGASSTS